MKLIQSLSSLRITPDVTSLTTYLPIPGYGVLPVNAFVIQAVQPVLVDTGLRVLEKEFLHALQEIMDPADLRWIWITHTDPDHLGNLGAILERAPLAKVVTTYLGMGKMGMQGIPLDRIHLLNPGQSLSVGDRNLTAFTPPTFDAPETTGLFDDKNAALFSADCFGALMQKPVEDAAQIDPEELREGCVAWSRIDAPWLGMIQVDLFQDTLKKIEGMQADIILSAHLPVARGMDDILLHHLLEAHQAKAFTGPDQKTLEQMMVA